MWHRRGSLGRHTPRNLELQSFSSTRAYTCCGFSAAHRVEVRRQMLSSSGCCSDVNKEHRRETGKANPHRVDWGCMQVVRLLKSPCMSVLLAHVAASQLTACSFAVCASTSCCAALGHNGSLEAHCLEGLAQLVTDLAIHSWHTHALAVNAAPAHAGGAGLDLQGVEADSRQRDLACTFCHLQVPAATAS